MSTLQVIYDDIASLATLGTNHPPVFSTQTSVFYTLSKRLEPPKAPVFGEKANHKLEEINSGKNNKGPKTISAHVHFKDGDEYLEEMSFAFQIDTKVNDVEPMVITYPGYVFVRRPIKKSISWIAMNGWEYIEHSQIADNGQYAFCLASKTMDHNIDNAVIVLKFENTVDARVILTPGYVQEDSLLYIEQYDLVLAVCHDVTEDEWKLVCFDLETSFADSCQVLEVKHLFNEMNFPIYDHPVLRLVLIYSHR